MKCRFCNTDIADKALICYRCGKPTTDPRVAPPESRSLFEKRRSKRPILITVCAVVIVIVVTAWYLLQGGVTP